MRHFLGWFLFVASPLLFAQGNDAARPSDPGRTSNDPERIIALYERAVRGEALAQDELGDRYYRGRGVPQNYSMAAFWFQKLAEQGNSTGENNLGFLYENGYGVPHDPAEAAKWYRKAADHNNYTAQANLGVLYKRGQGVPQDYNEAQRWIRSAAEHNAPAGQNQLGLLYKEGRGVAQDDVQAVQWFRRAAERGDAWGAFNLGTMYKEGRGVPKDLAQAQLWFQRSAQKGNRAAAGELKEQNPSSPAPSQAAAKPLQLDEVVESLQKGLPPKGMAKLVRQFGVDFSVDPNVEKSLRAAGADGDLLYVIATNKK
jgi:TPR repeat protein